jgi:hypothetical protein
MDACDGLFLMAAWTIVRGDGVVAKKSELGGLIT